MLFSPLEQFQILRIFSLHLFNFDFSITNSILFLGFIFVFFFTLMSLYNLYFFFIPMSWQCLFEQFFFFIKEEVILANIGRQNFMYIYFFVYLFLFILFANLFGMVPYSFALTSHIVITFSLSLIFFIYINVLGIKKHGLEMFGLFLPSGTPFFISPLLVLIEFISYIARVFSLAIRLFANIMSGHTLLHILASFGWLLLIGGGIWSLIFIFPTLIVFLVTFLETAIGFLQAYVFTVLCCNYLKDALYLH